MPKCPVCKKPRVMQATIDKYGKCSECNVGKKVAKVVKVAKSSAEPYKKKSIPAVLREQVWRKYFKNSLDGLCPICANKISFANHDCAHILAEAQGGSTCINNLRPTCGKCNKSMGTTHLDEFKDKINPIAVTHAKRVDPKYLIFWSEIVAVHEHYAGKLDEDEKKMRDLGLYTKFAWDIMLKIFIVLLEKLNNKPDDPLLKNEQSEIYIAHLCEYDNLHDAVKYAPDKFGGRDIAFDDRPIIKAYRDIIDRNYAELDKYYFKFNEVKLAKKIAKNVGLVGELSDYPELADDLKLLEELFNNACRDYIEFDSEFSKDRCLKNVEFYIKFTLIFLETHISEILTYKPSEALEFVQSKKGTSVSDYLFDEYIECLDNLGINYADIGTFYTLMFTDSRPYITEEQLKDILDLKNGYF